MAYPTIPYLGLPGHVEPAGAGNPERTYTVTDSQSGAALEDVRVLVSDDTVGANIVWGGMTDASGIARDINGKPQLPAGTYYFWKHKASYRDDDNPDTEVFT